MARRTRKFLDDDSDDSDDSEHAAELADDHNDPDTRAERELFENPYGRKRRRRANGKDDAIYGIFGDSEDDEDDERTRRKRKDLSKYVESGKSQWRKLWRLAPGNTGGSCEPRQGCTRILCSHSESHRCSLSAWLGTRSVVSHATGFCACYRFHGVPAFPLCCRPAR